MKRDELSGFPVDIALKNAPAQPGAYLLMTQDKQVLYVGKAVNIRARLRQHFTDVNSNKRHILLIERTRLINWIIVTDEIEALILEDALIKRHRPYFNIRFRDDKRYPLIRLDLKTDYPTLQVVRRTKNDGALYFGPYISARAMRMVLRIIDKYFPLRRCSGPLPKNKSRPCVYFETNRCCAPCVKDISKQQYMRLVNSVRRILNGNSDELVHILTLEMHKKSEELRFEEAAALRDQIKAIQRISKKRSLRLPRPLDIDIFVVIHTGINFAIEIDLVRSGTLTGSIRNLIDAPSDSSFGEILSKTILHYYNSGKPFPDEILVSNIPDDKTTLTFYLKKAASKSIPILHPNSGVKARLLKLATTNLKNHISIMNSTINSKENLFRKLGTLLDYCGEIHRIEAIDISETGGKNATASIISFKDGIPEKNRYRRFKIKLESSTNDLSRISEVLTRRILRKNNKNWSLPDIFLIDGGRYHQRIAEQTIKSLGVDDIPVISIAKARGNRQIEGIFLSDGHELNLPEDSSILRLLDYLRDEAHRFAIEYHRKIREKRILRSTLEGIKGLGPEKRRRLMIHFKSYERLYAASIEDLLDVPGIGLNLARKIFEHLRNKN